MELQKYFILASIAFLLTLTSLVTNTKPLLATTGDIVINEVELNPSGTDSGAEEAELYNPTNSDVDVGGWSISSTAGRTATVIIDEGTTVPSKGHLVVGRGSQWLDNVDEVIVLKDDIGTTIDTVGTFSDEDNDDATWQRSPDGDDNWVFTSGTFGEANFGTFVPEPEPTPSEPEAEEPESPPADDSSVEVTPQISSNDNLTLVFIDVGQGDSILIILPNKNTLLIDGGEQESSDEVLEVLQQYNLNHIDVVIATHPHADHIGGLIDVINTIDVGQILDSGQVHTTQTFEDLLDAIDNALIPLTSVREGGTINLDPTVKIEILNPPESLVDGADNEEEFNDNSVVLKLTYGEFTALLTGDMEQTNEARLVSENASILDVDLLKAGHHGSRTSSSSTFLDAVSPQVVIISLGDGNTYGHPHEEALQRIAAAGTTHILRTDIDGTITVTTTGNDEYTIKTSESNRTVVVPEFHTAILLVAIALISVIALTSGSRIWKSLGRV